MTFERDDGLSPVPDVTLAAIARPGDTVVIGFCRSLSDEEVEWMEESFRPLIDQGIRVAFADQVGSIVVMRPDDEDIDDWGDGESKPGDSVH